MEEHGQAVEIGPGCRHCLRPNCPAGLSTLGRQPDADIHQRARIRALERLNVQIDPDRAVI